MGMPAFRSTASWLVNSASTFAVTRLLPNANEPPPPEPPPGRFWVVAGAALGADMRRWSFFGIYDGGRSEGWSHRCASRRRGQRASRPLRPSDSERRDAGEAQRRPEQQGCANEQQGVGPERPAERLGGGPQRPGARSLVPGQVDVDALPELRSEHVDHQRRRVVGATALERLPNEALRSALRVPQTGQGRERRFFDDAPDTVAAEQEAVSGRQRKTLAVRRAVRLPAADTTRQQALPLLERVVRREHREHVAALAVEARVADVPDGRLPVTEPQRGHGRPHVAQGRHGSGGREHAGAGALETGAHTVFAVALQQGRAERAQRSPARLCTACGATHAVSNRREEPRAVRDRSRSEQIVVLVRAADQAGVAAAADADFPFFLII